MLVMELGNKLRIEHLTFTPDGRALVASADSGLHIWREIGDGRSAEYLFALPYAGRARFTCDGRWLITTPSGLWRIDPATGDSASSSEWNHYSVKFDVSPTEPLLLLTQPAPSTGQARTRMALWRADDLTAAGKLWEREVPGYAYHQPHFLPGGERFIRGEGGWVPERFRNEYRITTYDAANGATVGSPEAIPAVLDHTLLSPDGRWLVMRETNHLDLWPVSPGAGSPARVRNDNRKHFTDVAFHPSGKYLAATSNDQTVKLYETQTWAEARAFTWKLGRMRSIAFSPDGALAAAGTDKGQVVLWDVDL